MNPQRPNNYVAKPGTPFAQAPGCAAAAKKLAQGLTLIPYWGCNERGERVALSCWDTLLPGESLSQAALCLTRKMAGEGRVRSRRDAGNNVPFAYTCPVLGK